MNEGNNQIPFRDTIRQAPEYSKPFVANTLFGVQEWPFQVVPEQEGGSTEKKIVFEAHGRPSVETDPLIVRASYEASYGLKAKRTIVLRQFPNSEPLMMFGEVRYSFDELDISVSIGFNSPLVIPEMARDPKEFKPTIIVRGKDDQIPPLVFMDYQFSTKIPLHVQFANADYQQALRGEVEQRPKSGIYGSSYSRTYFQWGHLTGGEVGIARYDDPNDSDRLNFYRWFTKTIGTSPRQLENSPYKQKISRSEDRMHWGEGRLRFSRMNSQAGESWTFSVPEWIDIGSFHYNIQHSPLADFFWQYPVVFCVKRRGEERMWFSTHSQRDQARGARLR